MKKCFLVFISCLVCYLLGDSSPTSHFFTQISKEFEMISQISHYPLEKNQPASIISYPQIPRTLFLLSNLSPFCNMSVPFYYILKWQLISARNQTFSSLIHIAQHIFSEFLREIILCIITMVHRFPTQMLNHFV